MCKDANVGNLCWWWPASLSFDTFAILGCGNEFGHPHVASNWRIRAISAMVLAFLVKQMKEWSVSGLGQPPLSPLTGPLRLASFVLISLIFAHTIVSSRAMQASFFHGIEQLEKSTSSAVLKVSSSATLSRIRSSLSTTSLRLFSLPAKTTEAQKLIPVLMSNEALFKKPWLENLALSDLGQLFRYAIVLNRADFNRKDFRQMLREPAREAVEFMDSIMIMSRTRLVSLSRSQGEVHAKHMDALAFAVTLRIFAEWRSLRLVPDGYARYSLGMNMARRDLIQNVHKFEVAVHSWISYHKRLNEESTSEKLQTPTLLELLEFEISTKKLHLRRPRVDEQSGASGLLWAKRQLQYQTEILRNINEVPMVFPGAKEAVAAAYLSTYASFHGFVLRQFFKSSFDASPDAKTIFSHMNEPLIDECSTGDGDAWLSQHVELDRTEVDPLAESTPFDSLGHIFMKLFQLMSQCAGAHPVVDSTSDILDITVPVDHVDPTTQDMNKREVLLFTSAMIPLTQELEDLISDFNINDPAKV